MSAPLAMVGFVSVSRDLWSQCDLTLLVYRLFDQDATSMIAKCLFMYWLSYKQPVCNKYLHSSVTRYTTPEVEMHKISKNP